jgi:multisubunit Na+/H+ antiporter MnhC subunit
VLTAPDVIGLATTAAVATLCAQERQQAQTKAGTSRCRPPSRTP